MKFYSLFCVLTGVFLLVGAVSSLAFEPAKRITDREIVERLTRLETGQAVLNSE